MTTATTYAIEHRTVLTYARKIGSARYNLRLRPTLWPQQRLLDYSLEIAPQPARLAAGPPGFVVNTTRLEYLSDLTEVVLTSRFSIAIEARALPAGDATVAASRLAVARSCEMGGWAPATYLYPSRIAAAASEIAAWAADFTPDGAAALDAVQALSRAIHAQFAYRPGTTTSTTPPIKAFHARSGVCQDFAHILIIGLRAAGIPAGYVSGYLRTVPPPGRPRLVGADAMHAWVQAWCGPETGWVGIDPTNDCLAGEGHIAIAMGRDYADVSPIDGVFIGSSAQAMRSTVDVVPIEG